AVRHHADAAERAVDVGVYFTPQRAKRMFIKVLNHYYPRRWNRRDVIPVLLQRQLFGRCLHRTHRDRDSIANHHSQVWEERTYIAAASKALGAVAYAKPFHGVG